MRVRNHQRRPTTHCFLIMATAREPVLPPKSSRSFFVHYCRCLFCLLLFLRLSTEAYFHRLYGSGFSFVLCVCLFVVWSFLNLLIAIFSIHILQEWIEKIARKKCDVIHVISLCTSLLCVVHSPAQGQNGVKIEKDWNVGNLRYWHTRIWKVLCKEQLPRLLEKYCFILMGRTVQVFNIELLVCVSCSIVCSDGTIFFNSTNFAIWWLGTTNTKMCKQFLSHCCPLRFHLCVG